MKPVIECKPQKSARFFGLRQILALIVALFAAPLFAAPSLQDVAELLAKNKVTRGQFVLERKASEGGRALRSSGDFTIAADYGIIWQTKKPVKMTQAVAKDFAVTESAGGKRTVMDGSQNGVYLQMALLTSALWTNDLEAAGAAADLNFRSSENTWTLELFPKEQALKMVLDKIVVSGTCSEGEAVATEMKMQLSGGNSASYHMSGQTYDSALNPSELSFFRTK